MNRDILSGVVFTPASRTLDFSGVSNFDARRLRTVLHQPTNQPLYLAGGGTGLGGTWSGSVLTLAFNTNTAGFGASDPLTIAYGSEVLGLQADAAATSDAGAFSLMALIKRGLTNWTTLLARIPSPVSGRVPIDGSGVTQPVSASSLPLPAGAATAANQTTANAALGAPADAAFAGTGSSSIVAALKGVYALLAGTLKVQAQATSLFVEDATGGASYGSGVTAGSSGRTSSFGASAGLNGGIRDAGSATASAYAYFNATVLSPQSGSAMLQSSTDQVFWSNTTAPTTIDANVPLALKAQVTRRYHRIIVTNGPTAASNVDITTSFTSA